MDDLVPVRHRAVIDVNDAEAGQERALADLRRELAQAALEAASVVTMWMEENPIRATGLQGPWERELTLEVQARRVPSPYDVERHWPIMGLNDDPSTWDDPCDRGGCFAGGVCSAPRTTMGCGGCCHCMAACLVAYERRETAPHVWEGDQG